MLSQLATAHESVTAAGGAVVGVAPAAPYQARRLAATFPFPLLLDPQRRVAAALDLVPQTWLHYVFSVAHWWRYLKAFLRHRRQGWITGHYSDVPAVAVTSGGGEVSWLHRGSGIADYPPLNEVMRALTDTIGNND